MDEVDFLVIGSGSGLDVANAAANRGQSVAVVEKGPLGGTCLNRGCIPSKMLLYHADVLETIERAGEFDIDAEVNGVDFADIVRKVNEDVESDSESIREGLRSSSRHDLYEGEGRFVDDRTVEVVSGPDEGAQIRAETVLIAAGTRPSIPNINGLEDVDFLTSTEALQLETPPDHLVVVGGGYIAAELGHFLGTFGSDVTIIGRRPTLLPEADEEIAEAFTERYADRFTVHTGHAATAVSESDGTVTVEAKPYEYGEDAGVQDEDGVTVTGDELLVAAGRTPNTDLLNLNVTGVETGRPRVRRHRRVPADDRRRHLGAGRHRRRVPAETQREPRGTGRRPQPLRRRPRTGGLLGDALCSVRLPRGGRRRGTRRRAQSGGTRVRHPYVPVQRDGPRERDESRRVPQSHHRPRR